MTFFRLLLRNLLYHWRGNGAVLLGVAVGTASSTPSSPAASCEPTSPASWEVRTWSR